MSFARAKVDIFFWFTIVCQKKSLSSYLLFDKTLNYYGKFNFYYD